MQHSNHPTKLTSFSIPSHHTLPLNLNSRLNNKIFEFFLSVLKFIPIYRPISLIIALESIAATMLEPMCANIARSHHGILQNIPAKAE